MLSWLLPVLWLAASGDCLCDLKTHQGSHPFPSWVAASEPGKHSPVNHTCSCEQSARCWNRRAGTQCGPDELTFLTTESDSYQFEPERGGVSLTVSVSSPELSKCWQFLWRTALPPRAPSALS